MNKILAGAVIALSVFITGCASVEVFPGGPDAIWFQPEKQAVYSAAVADIKNLLGAIKFDGCDAVNLDIDKQGMRVNISCSETVYNTGTSDYYGNSIFDIFGPSETAYSTVGQQVQKNRIFSVAFAELTDVSLGTDNYVFIIQKSGKTLVVKADTDYDAKKFANAISSLAKNQGAVFTDCFGTGADWLTQEQKDDLNCGDAVVYARWLRFGGPSYNGGMRRNDVIVSVNSQKITDKASVEKIISEMNCNKTAEVEVLRYIEDGERIEPKKMVFKIKPVKK